VITINFAKIHNLVSEKILRTKLAYTGTNRLSYRQTDTVVHTQPSAADNYPTLTCHTETYLHNIRSNLRPTSLQRQLHHLSLRHTDAIRPDRPEFRCATVHFIQQL